MSTAIYGWIERCYYKNMADTNVEILATGNLLVGRGIRSIDAVTVEHMQKVTDRIDIAAYSFGLSGKKVLDQLEECLQRGVSVSLILNDLGGQPTEVKSRLTNLSRKYGHFKLQNFHESNSVLHAKIMVFDRKVAIIGSANFSYSAMIKNHEMGVLIEGEAVRKVIRAVDNLIK